MGHTPTVHVERTFFQLLHSLIWVAQSIFNFQSLQSCSNQRSSSESICSAADVCMHIYMYIHSIQKCTMCIKLYNYAIIIWGRSDFVVYRGICCVISYLSQYNILIYVHVYV